MAASIGFFLSDRVGFVRYRAGTTQKGRQLGLDDRDYMRDRQRDANGRSSRPFTRNPEASAAGTLWIVLAWVVIFFALFKAFSWWQVHKPVPVRPPDNERRRVSLPEPVPLSLPESAPSAEQPSPVYPYQPDQARVESRSVTKCVGRTGTSYADGPCPNGATSTTVTTYTGLNLSDGLPTVSRTPQPVPVERVTVNVPVIAPPVAVSISNVQAECAGLTSELHQLDARARQPQSGQSQDWIRDKQRALRARKFELRC